MASPIGFCRGGFKRFAAGAGVSGPGLLSIALRIPGLIAVVPAATWAAQMVRDAPNLTITPANVQRVHRAIMPGSPAFVGLLALPFVPGAGIGIARAVIGGGGIMMMAGVSGIFAPLPAALAVAVAVSPVPLAVMFLGA